MGVLSVYIVDNSLIFSVFRMCRVTRTGVDKCSYSDVLNHGCISIRQQDAQKAKSGTTWSLPIRPSLVRQEAFTEKEGSPKRDVIKAGDIKPDLG